MDARLDTTAGKPAGGLDTPKMAGIIVIGAVAYLALSRRLFRPLLGGI